jgi:hypothetical protein
MHEYGLVSMVAEWFGDFGVYFRDLRRNVCGQRWSDVAYAHRLRGAGGQLDRQSELDSKSSDATAVVFRGSRFDDRAVWWRHAELLCNMCGNQ